MLHRALTGRGDSGHCIPTPVSLGVDVLMSDTGVPPEEQRVQPADRPASSSDPVERPVGASCPLAPVSDAKSDRPTPAEYPGFELIGKGSAREILGRILVGDPLGLVERSRAWLDLHAYLVDSNRLAIRTLAHVAHSARHYRGKPDLHTWIELLLERSLRELINEDREAERLDRPILASENAPYGFVADALGIAASSARRACVIFNGMAEYDRRVFYATSVQGKSIHRHVSEGFGPPARAEAALQRVFRRMNSIEGMPGGGS